MQTAHRTRFSRSNFIIDVFTIVVACAVLCTLLLIGTNLALAVLFAVVLIVLLGAANYFLWGRTMLHEIVKPRRARASAVTVERMSEKREPATPSSLPIDPVQEASEESFSRQRSARVDRRQREAPALVNGNLDRYRSRLMTVRRGRAQGKTLAAVATLTHNDGVV